MLTILCSLYAWMPLPLYVACVGATVIFFIISFCHIIQFILDLIPFIR